MTVTVGVAETVGVAVELPPVGVGGGFERSSTIAISMQGLSGVDAESRRVR